MKKLFISLLILSISFCAYAGKGRVMQKQQYRQYIMEGGYFKCEIPKDWAAARFETSEKLRKIYGVEISYPGAQGGAAVKIDIDYYAKDTPLFKDMEDFIKRNSQDPIVKIKENKYGPVKDILAAGRNGKTFERETFVFIPPDSTTAVKTAIKEKLAVIPAKEGFYALRYYSPSSAYKKHMPIFDKVLKSFQPGR